MVFDIIAKWLHRRLGSQTALQNVSGVVEAYPLNSQILPLNVKIEWRSLGLGDATSALCHNVGNRVRIALGCFFLLIMRIFCLH